MKEIIPIDRDRMLTEAIDRKNRIIITQRSDYKQIKTKIMKGTVGQTIVFDPQDAQGATGVVGAKMRHKHYVLIFQTTCSNNSLMWPQTMLLLSRRVYERYALAGDVSVTFGTQHLEQHGKLEDISAGGMSVITSADPPLGRYQCLISRIPVTAILKSKEPCYSGFCAHFQFLGLEFNLRSLKQIVTFTKRCRSNSRNFDFSRLG